MFSSVAIIEAQIASVEAKRSRRRLSSSRTLALFISLMHALIKKKRRKYPYFKWAILTGGSQSRYSARRGNNLVR